MKPGVLIWVLILSARPGLAEVRPVPTATTSTASQGGFDGFSKRELWDMGIRFRGKWKGCEARVRGCQTKLEISTSTAAQAQVLPPRVIDSAAAIKLPWVVAVGAVALVAGFVLAHFVPAR